MPAKFPVLLYLIFINFVTTLTWWRDKQCAIAGLRRIPEKSLLTLCLLGGWPAAIWSAHAFRHKTRKSAFISQVGLAIAADTFAVCIWILIHPATS